MKIKKFIAKTLKEGKQLVLKELGEDAIILSSRTIRLADDNNEMLEIVAAIDENAKIQTKEKLTLPKRVKAENDNEVEFTEQDIYNIIGRLMIEISDIKSKLEDLSDLVKYKYAGVLNPKLGNLYKRLRKADINEQMALKIVGKISSENVLNDSQRIIARARQLLTEGIRIYPTIQKSNKRQVFYFIGPTGAGKSLTLIKLAVVTKLLTNSNVFIISTDTQKIGAAEQLQTYASIAAIPFKSVYSPNELKEYLEKNYESDFVFIDTIGKNPNDGNHLADLKDYIAFADNSQVFIVISGTSSERNISDVLKKYSELNPDAMIITKLDELDEYGELLSAINKGNLPIAYLCSGIKIPDDIEPADKDKLAKLVLPDNLVIDE